MKSVVLFVINICRRKRLCDQSNVSVSSLQMDYFSGVTADSYLLTECCNTVQ